MVGQEVVIRNSDRVGHNYRMSAGRNVWSVSAVRLSDVSMKDTIKHAERLPQTIECNMHDFMRGYLLVRHEPYNVVTRKDGTFAIRNIPVGKYEFQFWKDRYLKLHQNGNQVTGKRGVIQLEIKDGKTLDLGKLVLKKRKTR